jgi:hypothetical protein
VGDFCFVYERVQGLAHPMARAKPQRVSIHGNGAGASFCFAEPAGAAAAGSVASFGGVVRDSGGSGGDGCGVEAEAVGGVSAEAHGEVERAERGTETAEGRVWSDEDAAGQSEAEKPFADQIRTFHFTFIFWFSTMHVLRSNFFLGTANMVLEHMGDGE